MKAAHSPHQLKSQSQAQAVIYCRVSDPKQVTQGSGLGSQETRCREYARHKGYEVKQVFTDEGVSGGLIDRPGMQGMLSFLRKHKRKTTHIVIIDDISRLARGLEAHIHLRTSIGEAGGKLESPSIEFGEDSDSILVENLLASVSQHQRQKNAEQTKNRMRARAMAGYYVFIPPLGYRYERQSGHGKILVPDEPTAGILRQAMERFADGRLQTQVEVARYLEQYPSFPLVRNGRVHLQRIREILEKPIYAGYIDIPDWGLSLIKGKHEGLISFETFQKIQGRLNGKPLAPVRKCETSDDFLLRGFVACGECGHPMTAAFSKGRSRHYGYYFCQQKGCSDRRKNIRKEDIEEKFRHVLVRMTPTTRALSLFRDLLREAWALREGESKDAQKELQAAQGIIERKSERLMDRLAETDDPGLIAAYEAQLRKLQQDKLIILEKQELKTLPVTDFEETYRTALEFLSSPCKVWDYGDEDMQKLVLKLAFTGPLPYHRNGGYRTAPTSCIFRLFEESNDNMLGMVRGRGETSNTYLESTYSLYQVIILFSYIAISYYIFCTYI